MKKLSPAAEREAQKVLDKIAQRLLDEGYRRSPDGRLLSPTDLENYEGREAQPHERWRELTMDAILNEDKKRRESASTSGRSTSGKLENLAAHVPLVDRLTFDRVQNVHPPRDHPPSPSDRLLARLGIVRCANCGSRLVVKPGGDREKADGTHVSYKFYWCRGPDCQRRVAISATLVEGLVIAETKMLTQHLVASGSALIRAAAAKVALDEAEGVLGRTTRLLLAAGIEDEAEAVVAARKARERRDEAQAAYDAALGADTAYRLASSDAFDRGTLAEKRELIRAVIARVDVAKGSGPDRVTIVPR